MEAINNMIKANPKAQELNRFKQLVDEAGGDVNKAFYNLCRVKNIDPNYILGLLQ